MGWREETLARVCSDHWPATLLMGVQRWAEGCKALPIRERAVAAAECVGKAEKLIATRPKALQQVRMPQRILQNILALPIWDKRHELYACWALARLDGALAAHAPTLHHDDGVLKLRFQATHIATFDSLDGPHYVFSELRTPAGAPPKGKGRTANIQPDYRITRTTTGKPGPDTLLVLEVKQYAKASRANFVGAASDYAEGCPNARIVLVNYGGIPPSFAAAVPARHVARTVFIGGFRPYSPEDQDMEQQKLDEFMENVLAAIPLPMKTGVAGGLTGRSVLVIDVSGSMGDHLRTPMLADYVEKVLKAGKLSAVVAADTKVINSWPPDRFHASQLRHLNGGETQLGAALAAAHVELSTAIVITDSDGAEQLAGSDAMVLNVAEMASWPAC